MKVKIVRVRRAHIPGLKLTKPVLKEIGEVGKASIVDNIVRQKQADDRALKVNTPEWREHKRKKGWTDGGTIRSLVAQRRRFVRLANWRVKVLKQAVEIFPNATLKNLVQWVQEKGYTGWFAVSKKGRKAIQLVLRKWIKEEFRKARSKR